MSYDLEARLKEQGIYNSDQLLEVACTPAGRQALAAQVKVSTHAVLELANRADLARVRGIGGVFSDLFEHAGVDTAKELVERRPDNLHAKLQNPFLSNSAPIISYEFHVVFKRIIGNFSGQITV
jgi:predicted flap endonuclease-1-like 5' DNA nuclease